MVRASEMDGFDDPAWSDQDVQEVRPYAVTGGRTEPRHRMRLASLLRARREAPLGLTPEAERALALCRGEARSVAEIAGTLAQPVLVTKILLSDLIDSGALVLALTTAKPDDPSILEAYLAGLRNKFRECG